MTDTSFRGLFPILAMPFDENGNVDEEDLRKEVEFCISTGADAVSYTHLTLPTIYSV